MNVPYLISLYVGQKRHDYLLIANSRENALNEFWKKRHNSKYHLELIKKADNLTITGSNGQN